MYICVRARRCVHFGIKAGLSHDPFAHARTHCHRFFRRRTTPNPATPRPRDRLSRRLRRARDNTRTFNLFPLRPAHEHTRPGREL